MRSLRRITKTILLVVTVSVFSRAQCATDLKQSSASNPPVQCVPSTKTSSNHNIPVPEGERLALIALYKSTDGDHWKNHKGWLGPPGTECDWYGVDCEQTSGSQSIIDISLDDNNLKGVLPDELGKLSELESLGLSQNQLTGPIPSALVHLSKLTRLELLENHFSSLVPYPLIQHWLSGELSIVAESHLLSDITKIDFESNPSSLLCGRYRYILNLDHSVVTYRTRCRNASPHDRTTYCEVKKGMIFYYEFPRLGWLIEQNRFFDLKSEYDRNITEGTFENTRVIKNGKTHAISNYASAGPFELWMIQRAIEGVVSQAEWEHTTRQKECPEW